MPKDRRAWQLMDLPWAMKNPTCLMATMTVLIPAIFCQGAGSQVSSYTLEVPDSVTVQRGLCVHIPCKFTYEDQFSTTSQELYVYWFKNDGSHHDMDPSYYSSRYVAGSLVATNDPQQTVLRSAAYRFQLTGDPAQRDCSFAINYAELQVEGIYYFRIEKGENLRFSYLTNRDRSFISPQVSVTELTEKPKILNSSELVLGKSITLTCQAPGTCSWTHPKNWPKISWNTKLIGSTGSPQNYQHSNGSWTFASGFTFTPLLEHQGKALTCRVSYPAIYSKAVENTIHLDVTYPPQDIKIFVSVTRPGHSDLSRQIVEEDLVAQEGDTISLLCQAQGNPYPTLIWMKSNKTLNSSTQDQTLLLSNIQSEDAGEYQCQAKNFHGSIWKMLFMEVQYPPRTVTFSVSQARRRDPTLARDCPREVANGSQLTAQEGDSLQLLCRTNSNPPVTASWVKEGRTFKNLLDNWLNLTKLTVEDEGEYRCQVKNSIASAQGILHLYVAYAPKLSRNPHANTTCWREDNDLLCNCSLHSQPLPQIHWQVDGKIVTENSSRTNQKVSFSIQGNEVTSSLCWTGSPEGDHSIICLGKNSFGVYTTHFLLNSLKTGSHSALLISGLCGALLAVGVFTLGLCLIKFYKQRKATSKASTVEAVDSVDSANGGHQRANNFSLIYSNIMPSGQRAPYAGQSKAAGERNPKARQISGFPSPSTDEPDDLHYATVEFKRKGGPVPEEESVEYSPIKWK
ncbi:sialic acid-binding Ig-like lectin 10 isoform X1 [Rhineura floridana]|uniref:sialic acid-binding Ig-like lectin 10 isoform X1 n=1 Tax=Rhineura floridana TaxID=261503 RepID=UPI002AC83427|nr:sialic acid-binding Ig-like lectin 10 isoform X1 [Rhineura floridana]XP_061453405.1 sialic acid-binding Ig-like lectin 10 isoform X1 [Rhineura floridana]XP_061453406.1 sialic acid-binding Ig-like lectin 10 isoform X1 [Rhineura floridana]XP_061453407.1 sialic acid-binding Ig-like lectin 10 isoform X1 [Rhineura floridana]XP_061453409.1 sialic acid-binding Ig-like lectin 10 isoform X1 [Rhineura floridana]XP_061453410.1 sialic acid-binding Ig-like lectin 10 isoform X1 [Rhineura floridana]